MRRAGPDDYEALAAVMYKAVRSGPSPYTEAQRQAWIPEPLSGPDWSERLSAQTVILEDDSDGVAGFMSLRDDGYVDFAYIRPGQRGRGLFRKLFDEIRREARERALDQLWVHASLMAQPAFSAMGFEIVRRETVEIGDQTLERFEMKLELTGK